MTVKQINKNKAKVMMPYSEFHAYNLSFSDIGLFSEKSARLIYDILKSVSDSGFSDCDDMLSIKVVKKSHHLIFFITKLFKKFKTISDKTDYSFFVFSNKKIFSSFLKESKNNFFSNSYLYSLNGRLILKTPSESKISIIATEFSDVINSDFVCNIILAKAKLVCKNGDFSSML